MKPLDSIDKKILNLFLENSQISITRISEHIKITPAATKQRVDKLKANKYITGSSIFIDKIKLGFNTEAIIGIYLKQTKFFKEVIEKLNEISEIVDCYYTTGKFSLLIRVICKDNNHLTNVLSNKIQNIENIERTESYIILNTPINRNIIV